MTTLSFKLRAHVQLLKEVLSRAKNNVDYLLTISTVDKDCEKLLSIIKNNDGVYGTYGIHPHEAKNIRNQFQINHRKPR